MTKKKAPEKTVRRPRKSLAEKALEEYGLSLARRDRASEALRKARLAHEAATDVYNEAKDDLEFWEGHPAVQEMLERQTEGTEDDAEEADES